jgi:hypothetical protein
VTAGFALRIDALHGKAGQIFHFLSILGGPHASASRRQLEKVLSSPGRPNRWWKKHPENPSQEKNAQGKQTLWPELCRERPVVSR